jgi:hypothetical protein
MLADVPKVTWFANIKLLLWRFVDKIHDSHPSLWKCGSHVEFRPAMLARAARRGASDQSTRLTFPPVWSRAKTFAIDANA